MKGFVIGATGSGTGKTTLTLAMLSYFVKKGYRVAPFKVGPDFIDPGHHSRICGKISFNLDSWMLSKEYNKTVLDKGSAGADIAVVEGVMGLFDGYNGLSEAGSTAQMAKWMGLPVVLVISAKGKARSAAAIVKGFESFDKEMRLAGVIFTQTGSVRHYDYIKKAVEQSCETKCLGFMPRNDQIVMPERHLGLVTAQEMQVEKGVLDLLTSMVEDHIDMDALINGLPAVEPLSISQPPLDEDRNSRRVKIAVARDKAFCFYYQDNLDMLEKFGAELIEFSPLEDDILPDKIDGIYFGGGYPEVHASRLSENENLARQVKHASECGMPIYGECGGFMYLCSSLIGMDSDTPYKMTGCFDFTVSMSRRLRSLGYREVTLTEDTIIGKKGMTFRGHEFHYSSISSSMENHSGVYKTASRAGQKITLKGFQVRKTLGSYFHVHFGSNPQGARNFVDACQTFKEHKTSDAARKS